MTRRSTVSPTLRVSGAGTHDLVFGVDTYNDIRLSNNYQSPSNFFIWNYNAPAYGPDGTFYFEDKTDDDVNWAYVQLSFRY